MSGVLATIAGHVRQEVERRRKEAPLSALKDRALFHAPVRGFANSLKGTQRRIIAEIKRASPSKGVIRENFNSAAIAAEYASHGASAISVLTEERFFQGSLGDLARVHETVAVPLLRKDFIIDRYQLTEAKSYGADAVLLIAALLDPRLLWEFREEANSLALDTLIEVHTEKELDAALTAGAQLIGINNRDLTTFEVSLATTEKLAPQIPTETPAICESGIDNVEQIQRVERWGVHVFLIGESLMRAPNPGRKLAELLAQ
jgi:indole-3-glycerol phosphate synthase